MKTLFLMAVLFLCLENISVHASIKINEVYPAPEAGDQEWVELYNDEDKEIDLSGYSITDSKNNPLTLETNNSSPSGYILATGTNILNNSGDSVILKNASGETIESITYPDSFSSDTSYTRCPDTWIETRMMTKRDSNTAACVNPTASAAPEPSATAAISSTAEIPQTYDRIYISEVMVNPEEENEWVEIYNDNDFAVSLKNWLVDDAENAGSGPKSVSIDIAGKSYAVYDSPSSMFNNDTDTVRLLNQSNNVKDSFSYYSSMNGLSIGKPNPTETSICITNPTKGYANGACIEIHSTSTSVPPTPTVKLTPTISPYKITPYQTSAPALKITLRPTTKKLIRPTIHLPQSLFESQKQSSEDAVKKTKGQVLGAKTPLKKPEPQPFPFWKIASLVGLLISFLTIVKIFFRIKYKADDD